MNLKGNPLLKMLRVTKVLKYSNSIKNQWSLSKENKSLLAKKASGYSIVILRCVRAVTFLSAQEITLIQKHLTRRKSEPYRKFSICGTNTCKLMVFFVSRKWLLSGMNMNFLRIIILTLFPRFLKDTTSC